MKAYLDTSVVLRVLFGEPHPIRIWGKWETAYSSALWRVEALRTVDRLRLTRDITDSEVAALVENIGVVHGTLALHPVSEEILRRASQTFPTVVGTSTPSTRHCAGGPRGAGRRSHPDP
jgi:predicted nucleic acid-binding protein